MDDLLKEFLSETMESIEVMDFELVRFEQEPTNSQILDNIFRLMHTIKGTCGFLGLPNLQAVAHAAETLMGRYREDYEVSSEGVTLILRSIDEIKAILLCLEQTGAEPETINQELIDNLNLLAGHDGHHEELPSFKDMRQLLEQAEMGQIFSGEEGLPDSEVPEELMASASDDMSEEKAETPQAPEQKHEVEMPVVARANGASGSDRADSDRGDQNKSVRVNLSLLEHLMNTVSELVLTRNQLLEISRHQSDSVFKVPLQRLSNVTAELQDSVVKTRMQPIGNAWKKLPRIVRDLAQTLNKKIDLKMIGEETELDRQVLEMIKDPLTHMVRNSADHGIETADEREACGKSRVGEIILSAYHEGGHINIKITDNGKGLNADSIRRKIIKSRMVSESEAGSLSDQQLYYYIFEPGFSTAQTVTSVSGRGVGMDVVRTNIQMIGGTINLDSTPGQGTTFTIKIPLTLAIVPALIVEVGGDRFAIPQLSVVELVRTRDKAEQRIETIQGAKVIRLRDQLLPLISIADVFGLTSPKLSSENSLTDKSQTETSAQGAFIVVMQVGKMSFGAIVDNVFHTEEIVVKPMSSRLKHLDVFSGNTILGDGRVIMIVDPNGIAKKVQSRDLNRAREEESRNHKGLEEESQALLLFRAGRDEPKVVPLSLVTRLEVIDSSAIEVADGNHVVQYRGGLMPLVMVSQEQSLRDSGKQPMIVFTEEGRSMGLVIDQFIDIVDEVLDITIGSDQDGVLGIAVIKGEASEVIDVGHYLTQTHDDWFLIKDNPGLSAKPTALLVDDSAFFRNLLRPIIQSAGYRVTVVSSAEEAMARLTDGQTYEAIISDLDMEPIDGFAFAAQVQDLPNGKAIPMIAIASQARPQHAANLRTAGFQDFVGKFDRPGLVAALKSLRTNTLGDAA